MTKLATAFLHNATPDLTREIAIFNEITGERERISIAEFFTRLGITVTIDGDTTTLSGDLDIFDSGGATSMISLRRNNPNDGSACGDFVVLNEETEGAVDDRLIIIRGQTDGGAAGAKGGAIHFLLREATTGSFLTPFKIDNNQDVTLASLGTGTVYSNVGTLTNVNPSDERVKTIHGKVPYGLKEVLQLEPILFNYEWDEDDAEQRLGYSANKVKEIIPELVGEFDHDGKKRLGFTDQTPNQILVNAIKELNARIEALEAKLK